ncbi:10525_t:CDS:2 [Funneliformis geosporum]|uniref:10525_t:CDS:1 n=1 Tax=Funneliformis geosporum TaxID=1117311 RepID=A0A9W4SK41_9GLOM|nr:10525_t:CDS:2 [Funneliformis geosporum]
MNNSITSSVAKGNEFEAKVFWVFKSMNFDCQRSRELEAHRGHRVRLLGPSNRTCERPSLFYFISESLNVGTPMSDGDGGVDIWGNYMQCLILVQCKNYSNKKVEVGEVRDFEGVLSRYPRDTTIGIFITSIRDGYSGRAVERMQSSEYNEYI